MWIMDMDMDMGQMQVAGPEPAQAEDTHMPDPEPDICPVCFVNLAQSFGWLVSHHQSLCLSGCASPIKLDIALCCCAVMRRALLTN